MDGDPVGMIRRAVGLAPLTLLYVLALAVCRVSGLARRWWAWRLRIGGPNLSVTFTTHRYNTVTRLPQRPGPTAP